MNFIQFSDRSEDGIVIENVINMNYVTRIQHYRDKDKTEVVVIYYQLTVPYTQNQVILMGEGAASLWQAYNTWMNNQHRMLTIQ